MTAMNTTRTRMIALAAVLLVGLACGSGDSGRSTGTDTPPPPVETTSAAVPESTQPATTAPPTAAGTSFGDGIWRVPEDVKPGTYRTTVPATSVPCYWERLRGLSGGREDRIANGLGNSGNQVVVTIAAGDKGFKSERCGTWTKVG